jgi:beta-lactam-binding protein with PASTA domain
MINKEKIKNNLLSIATLNLIIWMVLLPSNLSAKSNRYARVPNINGVYLEQAIYDLKQAGFKYKIKRYQFVLPKYQEGKVYYVYPTGSQPIGTTISFAVTKHWIPTTVVPKISGMHLRSAYIKVVGHGYKFKIRETKYTSDYKKSGKVYDPIPAEGTKLKSGSTVSVISYKKK